MFLKTRFIQVTDPNFAVSIGRRMNESIVADVDTDNACNTMIAKENQVPFLQIRPVDAFSQPRLFQGRSGECHIEDLINFLNKAR